MNRWAIQHYLSRRPVGVVWSYAERDGSCVLKSNTSWRKINGIGIYTSRKSVWILFRRTS